jgi:replicative DNA helicase
MSRWETYNFTNDFQDMILACLIRHPEEFYAFGEIIKPEFFTGSIATEAVFNLMQYRTEYGKVPNFTVLANYAFHRSATVNIDHAKELFDYIEKLASIETSERKYIVNSTVKFAKERAIYDAIRKIHAAQTEGKPLDVVKVMSDAQAVGENMNDYGLSLAHDTDKIIDTVTQKSYGVMTGYAEFDKLWKTGWAPGWLIVPLAPPKRYKTTFSINLALNIVTNQDADVLYYACEISQELAGMRALCNVTGWSTDAFYESPEKGKLTAKKAVDGKLWGNIVFKSYPSKSASISQIKAHAKHLIETHSLNVRAIIIDYAETVKADKVDKDMPDWRQQADIYTQARAMGSELGCCVIMPDRCNKDTVGRDVPSMKSFQGAFEKAGIVDIAIGLCASDSELKQNRMRYFVFLNRHGEALKHYEGSIDPERMQMSVGSEIEYNPDEEENQSRGGGSGHSRSGLPKKRTSAASRQAAHEAAMTQADG